MAKSYTHKGLQLFHINNRNKKTYQNDRLIYQNDSIRKIINPYSES